MFCVKGARVISLGYTVHAKFELLFDRDAGPRGLDIAQARGKAGYMRHQPHHGEGFYMLEFQQSRYNTILCAAVPRLIRHVN